MLYMIYVLVVRCVCVRCVFGKCVHYVLCWFMRGVFVCLYGVCSGYNLCMFGKFVVCVFVVCL